MQPDVTHEELTEGLERVHHTLVDFADALSERMDIVQAAFESLDDQFRTILALIDGLRLRVERMESAIRILRDREFPPGLPECNRT